MCADYSWRTTSTPKTCRPEGRSSVMLDQITSPLIRGVCVSTWIHLLAPYEHWGAPESSDARDPGEPFSGHCSWPRARFKAARCTPLCTSSAAGTLLPQPCRGRLSARKSRPLPSRDRPRRHGTGLVLSELRRFGWQSRRRPLRGTPRSRPSVEHAEEEINARERGRG